MRATDSSSPTPTATPHYADMMFEASQAIHEVCPECTVLSGGLFQLEQVINGAIRFTHDMLTHRKDVFDHIDVFGVHPYTFSYPPQFPPELDGDGERALGGMLTSKTYWTCTGARACPS